MLFRNAFTHDARGRREAVALARAGHRVTVVAVHADPSLPAREEHDGVVVERIRVTGKIFGAARAAGRGPGAGRNGTSTPAPESTLRNLVVSAGRTTSTGMFEWKAAHHAAGLHPDVYHCRDFNTLLGGVLASRRSPASIVYDSNELYAHLNVPHPTMLRRYTVETLEGWAIHRAAHVITVSPGIAEHLARRYGIPKPTVIMNVPSSRPAGATAEVPEPFRLGGVKILYLGGITPRRGIEQAIDALPMLPGARLIAMGPVLDQSYLRAVNARAQAAGVAGRFHVLPPVPAEHVIPVASHATVGLVAMQNTCLSHYLALPNKLFECLHAGLPVVASDFPETRRVVEEHDAGRTCDPGDPASIAAAISAVVQDPERHEAMSRNARAAAVEFSWEREAPKLLALYETLAPLGARA